MLVSDLAKRLLVFTDQRTLSEALAAGTEYLESAVDALNSAAQQIYLLGPSSISVRDFGLVTQPVTLTAITGTALSTSATFGSAAPWMAGCTFVVDGDGYNRVLELSGNVATIQNPLKSAKTTAPTTIWNDGLTISPEIVELLDGVTLDDTITLRPATNEQNLYSESAIYGTTDYGRNFPNRMSARPPTPGQPRAFYVAFTNPNQNTTTEQQPAFMRLCPYPLVAHTIRFRARVRPTKITVADLDASNDGDACTKQIPIPAGWDELLLLPVAKQIFTGSPFFNNTAQRDEIARAYKQAMDSLDNMRGQSMRPLRFTPNV